MTDSSNSIPGCAKLDPSNQGLADPLYDPPDAEVDIVFVHGLGGRRDSTWTHASGAFWPKDFLPETCPRARILTFGYSSDWFRFFGLGADRVSHAEIADHSVALLADLHGLRNRTSTNDRPIFFVAHSLGGLICANALSMQHGRNEDAKHLTKKTQGIMFFGTPFLGSSEASWAALAQDFFRVFKGHTETNKENIKALKEGSKQLVNVNHNFAKFLMDRASSATPVGLVCFFEELSVRVKGRKIPGIGQIVPKESAVIVGVDPIGIEDDHLGMCKFADDERRGYRRASEALIAWIKKLSEQPKDESRTAGYSVTQGEVHNRVGHNYGNVVGNVFSPVKDGIVLRGATINYGYQKGKRDTEWDDSSLDDK